jgi:hypothetical protein
MVATLCLDQLQQWVVDEAVIKLATLVQKVVLAVEVVVETAVAFKQTQLVQELHLQFKVLLVAVVVTLALLH